MNYNHGIASLIIQITKTGALISHCTWPLLISSLFFGHAMASDLHTIRIAPEITSYSWNIYEHPDMGTAL